MFKMQTKEKKSLKTIAKEPPVAVVTKPDIKSFKKMHKRVWSINPKDHHIKTDDKEKVSSKDPPRVMVKKTDVKSFKKMHPRVWAMTSKEFDTDPDARLDFMISRMKDKKTVTSFQKAIRWNRHLFVGRKVLVLNCGVDLLLTLWASKIGADHVYGVDTSHAIEYLSNVISANKLSDNITLIHGKIQDIELPVKEVDIIISNWMGYSLLIDSKIEDVIYARDKWLKKDTGIIFPDVAQFYVVGIENSKNKHQHVDWWRDVNGFNMKTIRNWAQKEPIYQTVQLRELLTGPVNVWSIDLNRATVEELQFRRPFFIEINRCGSLEGILTFFDVNFSKSHTNMSFSTSPWSERTNWLQTVFYFNDPVPVTFGLKIYCGISMRLETLESNFKSFKLILELYSGDIENLSEIGITKWIKKTQHAMPTEITNSLIETSKQIATVNHMKESSKKKFFGPSESPLKKQSKKKPAEKRKRVTRKISAAIFFD